VRCFSWGIEAKVGSRSRDFLAAFHGAKPASAIYQRRQLHGPSVRAELAESVERLVEKTPADGRSLIVGDTNECGSGSTTTAIC